MVPAAREGLPRLPGLAATHPSVTLLRSLPHIAFLSSSPAALMVSSSGPPEEALCLELS